MYLIPQIIVELCNIVAYTAENSVKQIPTICLSEKNSKNNLAAFRNNL